MGRHIYIHTQYTLCVSSFNLFHKSLLYQRLISRNISCIIILCQTHLGYIKYIMSYELIFMICG